MALFAVGVPKTDRASFQRNGYVQKDDYLPEAQFQALLKAVREYEYEGEIRQCWQGDTLTHRILLAPEVLSEISAARAVLEEPALKRLFRYCAGHARLPICHIENVHNRGRADGDKTDPQKHLYVDTFQPTMKFWLYLEDVTARNGPFEFVPGSNRPHRERLKWEYEMSLKAKAHANRYTARGSFRVSEEEAQRLGHSGIQAFEVKANTLLIANTFGVHARGHAEPGSSRLALWGMARTNPFSPLPGLGFGYFNRLQYRVFQRMRIREDERAAKRNSQASWHVIEQKRI